MQYEHITRDQALREFCDRIASASYIAFDTEFVSEDSYRPQLCLIQVAADDHLAIVDPLAVRDLTPFWELISTPPHETIVHAGREEVRFCLHAIGRPPHRMFDVQLAAGMAGCEYPASYGNLIGRLLNQSLSKGETRTDWRRRPLSDRQLDYALQDVEYLKPLKDTLSEKLAALGRTQWFEEELIIWREQIEHFERTEQWRRVAGVSSLGPRGLAIVRELWRWRDAEAQRRNQPPRRVLRDDLIVELARRQTADARRIRAVRGLDYRGLQNHLQAIGDAVQSALNLAEDQLPQRVVHRQLPQFSVLTQFLAAALSNVCRAAQIAPTIVGTVDDIREFIVYRLQVEGGDRGTVPALLQGWRGELVGKRLDDLLAGRLTLHVANPLGEDPLEFVAIEP